MLLIQDRSFSVTTSDGQKSRTRRLPNRLPQGSVLAPTLFNIYTADMPSTRSTKFLYADDSALGFALQNKGKIEEALQSDLNTICTYYQKWHLKISTTKSVCSLFHLSSIKASEKLKILYNGWPLRFEKEPTYLGVTLDWSLTFAAHKALSEKKFKNVWTFSKNSLVIRWYVQVSTLWNYPQLLLYFLQLSMHALFGHIAHTH